MKLKVEMWVLILVFWISTSGGSTEKMEFKTSTACTAAGKSLKDSIKKMEFSTYLSVGYTCTKVNMHNVN